jgi:transposase InsO family protein
MTEHEQRRLVNHRLSVLQHAVEVTGNVSQTCRYYGISRQTFYKWLRRYEEQGLEGLRDRSSRPHYSPNATSAEVVGKIMYLRQHYHFGPQKIAMYLKRYHDIRMSSSGVWRVLERLGMNRLPASQKHKTHQKRWKRYEKPQPGHRVQVDVKFITPVGAAGKKFYQFTAIDDCTRIRVLRAYPRCNQKTAIQFLDYLLARLPFRVDVIQTDNGGEFGTQFHYHVLDRGISHVYIRPATPRLNGKVERSHRIDEEEFYRMLEGIVIDDTELFNDKLQEWENFYNFNRPHGALDGQTPYERLKQKTQSPQV